MSAVVTPDRDLAGRALALAKLHDQPLSMNAPLTPEQHAAIATYLFETADTSEVLRELARRVERQASPAAEPEPAKGAPPPETLWFGLTWPDVTLLGLLGVMLWGLIALLIVERLG